MATDRGQSAYSSGEYHEKRSVPTDYSGQFLCVKNTYQPRIHSKNTEFHFTRRAVSDPALATEPPACLCQI